MKILRALWAWLMSGTDTPVSDQWLREKQYDRNGWEGPTYRGRFGRD
jgi:hypothetical protein